MFVSLKISWTSKISHYRAWKLGLLCRWVASPTWVSCALCTHLDRKRRLETTEANQKWNTSTLISLICQTQIHKSCRSEHPFISFLHTVSKEASDFKTEFATQIVCLCSGLAAPRARLQHSFLESVKWSINRPTGRGYATNIQATAPFGLIDRIEVSSWHLPRPSRTQLGEAKWYGP